MNIWVMHSACTSGSPSGSASGAAIWTATRAGTDRPPLPDVQIGKPDGRQEKGGRLSAQPWGHRLSGEVAQAGVAYLRAKGYRSAELYLSAAVCRHRASHPVEGVL